jgi:hypothetical protein
MTKKDIDISLSPVWARCSSMKTEFSASQVVQPQPYGDIAKGGYIWSVKN